MIRHGSKDSILEYKKTMVVYQFNCFCEDSYVCRTSRQFRKKIKKYIPKCIDEFCKISDKKNKSKRVTNASKTSATAEHLVNNCDCASNYNLKRFKCIENCKSIFDSTKFEAMCFSLRKPKLCKHKNLIKLFLCFHI